MRKRNPIDGDVIYAVVAIGPGRTKVIVKVPFDQAG
jgi:hypothetical protein